MTLRTFFGHVFACAAVVFATALACAQPRAEVMAPTVPWRQPLLQVQGAEQPVTMESLRLAVEISGGVAETRVEMVFRNPNLRTLEGKLLFPLAEGQVVSGFALDIDGRLRNAVPVEKVRAQQVFEDISRRRVDPGLLQTALGNQHELRIYPLLAGKTRTVVLTIVEPAATRLRVPLAYADKVRAFELDVRVPGALTAPTIAGAAPAGLRFERDARGGFVAHASATDVVLSAQALVITNTAARGNAPAFATETRDGTNYFTLDLPVPLSHAPRALPRRVQIVWDASGSAGPAGGRRIDRELALLDAYFARARDSSVSLVRVADTVSADERFEVHGGDWHALRRALESTTYDGASNLGAVRHDGSSAESLWFTDGLATYGAPWQLRFPVPVFAVQSAPTGDPAALQALADASGGRRVDLGVLDASAAADALLTRGTSVETITAVGARDIVQQSQSAAAGRVVLAGVLSDGHADVAVRLRDATGKVTTRTVAVDAGTNPSRLAALQWARLSLAALEGDARVNKQRIRAIGKQFGLATRETSLLVLELVDDYVRHQIEPPAELRAAYAQGLAGASNQKTQSDAARLAQVVRRFEERTAWWAREFPKDAPLQVTQLQSGGVLDGLADAPGVPQRMRRIGNAATAREEAPVDAFKSAAPASPAAMSLPSPARPIAQAAMPIAEGSAAARSRKDAPANEPSSSIAISLTPAARSSESLNRLRAARPTDRLAVYLDERRAQSANVGFYLEAGDFFLGQGERVIGLRVLSNLAEMDLQNRQVLRLLAYRLQQANAIAEALPLFERVLELAPNEPQSHRDLGLALAASGQPQRAVERLYEVATGAWDARFADIELIAVTEMNVVIEQARRGGRPVDLVAIEPRLLKSMPLDLRVVLAWDADNTDVDLHVIDPNGEEVFYGHALSYQGGAITHDATGGYGPEEFALRVAKPGKYRVEANFFGHRQQVLTTGTGLMLWFSSGYGTAAQQDQRTTVRVKSERGERVLVGEFEVER